MKLLTFLFIVVCVLQGAVMIQLSEIFWIIAIPLWFGAGYYGSDLDEVLEDFS